MNVDVFNSDNSKLTCSRVNAYIELKLFIAFIALAGLLGAVLICHAPITVNTNGYAIASAVLNPPSGNSVTVIF